MSHPPPPAQPRQGLTRDRALVLVLAAATVAVFGLCLLLAAPFVPVLTWAVALAIVARPLHRAIASRVARPSLAAGLSVAVVGLVILLPVLFVLGSIAAEATNAAEWAGDPRRFAQAQADLEATPVVGQALVWLREDADLQGVFQSLAISLLGTARNVAYSSMLTVVQFLLVLFTLFFLFRDYHEAGRSLRRLMPLTDPETDEVFRKVGETVHATLYGSVLTSLIQGTLGGLIFWQLGLPAPVLWGTVMAILSLIPNLGAFVVWTPAALLLAINGEWGRAAILAAWGLVAIGLIDNLLFPILVGKRMRLHTLLLFYTILGGLLIFGASGLVLGPVILVLFLTLVEVWRRRTEDGKAAEAALQPQQGRRRERESVEVATA